MRTREADKTPRLRVYWSKAERDLIFWRDGERNGVAARAADAHLLYDSFCCQKLYDDKSLVEMLKDRGYDMSTLRFSIRRKPLGSCIPYPWPPTCQELYWGAYSCLPLEEREDDIHTCRYSWPYLGASCSSPGG